MIYLFFIINYFELIVDVKYILKKYIIKNIKVLEYLNAEDFTIKINPFVSYQFYIKEVLSLLQKSDKEHAYILIVKSNNTWKIYNNTLKFIQEAKIICY